jgi:hypothetical protein
MLLKAGILSVIAWQDLAEINVGRRALNKRECKKLMVGLPGAGKTTFLAALWHVVEEGDIETALKLKELHGDRRHLDVIRDNWLCLKKTERTKTANEQLVSMILEGPDGDSIELFLPDMSGESFDGYWTDRRWDMDHEDLVQEASGALFFIHPSAIVVPHRIDAVDRILSEFVEEVAEEVVEEGDLSPFDKKDVPTQVKLVEILQFIESRRENRDAFNISVVVSAWDLLENHETCPEDWLRKRLPLLFQYLKSNVKTFPFEVYGVSAQGGDLDSDMEVLQKTMRPSERIRVVRKGDSSCNNITLPIENLMV